jgi:CheY-like chemotaxis protein
MTGDREQYLAAGMTDYVAKPINLADLQAAIARCAGQGQPRARAGARGSA